MIINSFSVYRFWGFSAEIPQKSKQLVLFAQKELEAAQKKTGGALGNIFCVFDFLVVLQLLLIPDNRLQYDYIPKYHEFPCEYCSFLQNRVPKIHCEDRFLDRKHIQSISTLIKYRFACNPGVILDANPY